MRLDSFDRSLCQWYLIDNAVTLQNRIVPRIFGEHSLGGEPIEILLTLTDVDPTAEAKISLFYRGEYLPVYDDGWFFVSKSGHYITKKNRSDNSVFLGVILEPAQ